MNIEELDLDIKVYNRLKKNLPDVCTINHLIAEMYDEHGVDKVSAPDMKAIEKALKDKGIFKYMRGDEVSEDDIEPTPLTWDELHQYVGGLVVCDDSTESHRWLHLCWIYSISDEGDTSMMYLCRGNSYLCTRKQYVESDTSATVEMHGDMLRHSGHFFALKQHALRLDSLEDNWPYGDLFYYSDSPEAFGKELTYEELCALPANTQVLIDDTFDGDDEDEDLAGELWRKDSQQYSEGVRFECLDDDDCIQTQIITKSMMEKRSTYYTRVFLKAGGAVAEAPKPKADIIPQEPAKVIVPSYYSRAIALTRSIIANAQAAQQSMWEVCKGLNEMKERKLYKEIGYSTFEDYCEQEIGITRRQGQKYAAVASLDGKSTSDFEKIGIEKLYLLTKIDEEQSEQITDVESVTVRELKAQIDALKHQNDQTEAALEDAEGRAQRWCDDAEEKRQKIEEQNGRFVKDQQEIAKLNAEIYNNQSFIAKLTRERTDKDSSIEQLQARITELESRPVEVAVQTDTAELEKLRAEYEEKLKAAEIERKELEDELIRRDDNDNFMRLDINYREARAKIQSLCTMVANLNECKEKETLKQNIRNIIHDIEQRIGKE